jgi:HD-GYP domain-containing protein (c-di-GMP phosphodiesterase class II)
VGALAASDQLFWTAHRPGAEEGGDHLALHQTRAAIIALRLGVALGYEGRRLSELGMGACLFDAGLWELPAHVALAADALSAADQELYRSHPKRSAALLRRWGAPSDLIIDAVLQHHEREQGQGYPQGVRGPAVHPDAKIIGLADAYAGLIVPPPPRAGRPPHDAIRELMRWRRHAFDPVLIKALVNETTLFPPGTLVRLSSGQLARVLQLDRTHPLRPRVEVLKKDHTVARVIDLVQHPFVYITGAAPQ